jgi:hypothetical protein
VVGEEKKYISCHRILLGYHSKFFDSALYGDFPEAQLSEMSLPDDNPDQIRTFFNWLYTGYVDKIDYRSGIYLIGDNFDRNIAPDHIPDEEIVGKESKVYMERLWILGDRLLAPEFTNDVMLGIIGTFEARFFSAWETEFVFENRLPGSKLRLLFHDIVATEGPL